MGIDVGQLIDYVIKPSQKMIDLYSRDSEELVLGTAAQESGLGTYLHQLGGGPALSMFQIEPVTYWSMWNDFLAYKPDLKTKILSSCGYATVPHEDFMITNLMYAAMMCRIRYFWVSEKLPAFGDIEGQGAYWAKYYNGNPVNGVAGHYVDSFNHYVGNFYARP